MCSVAYCTSSYNSLGADRVSLYQFPKNEHLKKMWTEAIPHIRQAIGPSSKICEKHFAPDQIVRTWESGSGATKILINLKRSRLVKNAIPCIFQNPMDSSTPLKKKRSLSVETVKRDSVNEIPNDYRLNTSSGKKYPKMYIKPNLPTFNDDLKPNPVDAKNQQICNKPNSQVSNIIIDPLQNQQICNEPNSPVSNIIIDPMICKIRPITLFLEIFNNPNIILLPKGWDYRCYHGKNHFVTFYYPLPCCDGTNGLVIGKQLSLGKDMAISCTVYNELFNLNNIGVLVPSLPSVEDIINIIKRIEEYNVCIGGPLKHPSITFSDTIASFGFYKRWRHNKCEYLINRQGKKIGIICCPHCKQLHKSFQIQKKRVLDNEKSIIQLSRHLPRIN